MEQSTAMGCESGEALPGVLTPRNIKVKQSHYRPEVPRGFQEVKIPRLRDNGWW